MVKKLVIFFLTFVVLYVFNFFVPRLMPGDPFSFSDYTSSSDTANLLSDAQKEKLMEYYGFDQPLGIQFVTTVRQNLSGDFGMSTYYKKPVWDAVVGKLGWSLYIMGTTLVLSLVFGVGLALLGLQRKRLDMAIYSVMSVLAETPAFLVGIALLFLVAAKVKFIPISGAYTNFGQFDNIWQQGVDILLHSLMPISAMVLVTTPLFYVTARSSFLSVLEKRYMLTAKAKGLSGSRVRRRYILLNGMMPVVARFFLSVGSCVGATLLIENVFAYPGLGKLMRDAVQYRDYPLIQGVFLLVTTFVLVCSFASDLIGSKVDKSHASE